MKNESYDDQLKQMGQRIKALRLANGFTKASFSRLTEIDVVRITRYEEEGGGMNLTTLLVLADALGVKAGALLDGGEVTITKSVTI